jgi:hypothetical protein
MKCSIKDDYYVITRQPVRDISIPIHCRFRFCAATMAVPQPGELEQGLYPASVASVFPRLPTSPVLFLRRLNLAGNRPLTGGWTETSFRKWTE